MADNYLMRCGDSRELIKNVGANSIDLLLTDPPYNIAQYSTGNIQAHWRKEVNNDLAEWDLETLRPLEWVEEFARVTKPDANVFIFTTYNMISLWHDALHEHFDRVNFFIWHKTNPIPKFRKSGFLNSCEMVVCAWNKKHRWNFTTQNEMHNLINSPICMGKERLGHPTQKPIRVLSRLIETGSNTGDIVLDPFAGVASVGAAALRLGRSYVGFEREEEYYNRAVERLENEQSGRG